MRDKGFLNAALGRVRALRARPASRPLWHSVVAIGVSLVHLLVILWMVSGTVVTLPPPPPEHKTQLLWLLLPKKKAPAGVKEPTRKSDIEEEVYKAVQLLDDAPKVERPNAITMDPGLALGQALACGAGQYEYLTPEGKRRCSFRPWDFTYDRDGYIILREPRMPYRKPRKVKPQDHMRQQRYSAPSCAEGATAGGAPCIDSMLPHPHGH